MAGTKTRNIAIAFALCVITVAPAFAQDKPAYRVFNSEGKEVQYSKLIKSLGRAEIIFFGELHNNPIAHWLELEIATSLYGVHPDLVLAMEMFEADDQIVLDEYLGGVIEEKNFLKEAKIWDNYRTDYKPLVEFARENKLKVVASNIPRRYASLVYKKGLEALDSLTPEAQKWISPPPREVNLELSGYKKMINEMKGHGGNPENLAISQAIKDATMAHFIIANKNDHNIIFHVNGAYHSQDREGIVWYIKKLRPHARMATIHVVEQAETKDLEKGNAGKADFIICIPDNMTKTN